MPRAVSKGRTEIDEDRLIDLIKLNPELYDESYEGANNSILKKNIWKNIAGDLDASVDICKKVWIKLKENYAKEVESKGAKRNRRKSLRSCLTEKNLEFLNDISVDNSNKDSRASSNCSSPKDDEKRRLRSSTRSLSNLGSISEILDLESLASSSTITITPKKKAATKSGSQSAGRTPRKMLNLDRELQENNSNERKLADGRYKNIPQPAVRTLRPRFSEPSHLASKENLKTELNITPQPQSVAGSNGRNGRMRKSPNPSDPTHTFFESMALTVSTFPQHLQAAMKVRICTIIAETEYDLSSPKVRLPSDCSIHSRAHL